MPAAEHQAGPAAGGGSANVTAFFYLMVSWVVLASFNYGYGISELNPLQSVISCPHTETAVAQLKDCMPITDTQFGYVTALFTLGGLLSSILTSPISSYFHLSPRKLVLLSATFNALGGATQSLAAGKVTLGLGRAFMGMGAGIGVVIVPRYLSEISPLTLRGSVGVLNQLGIVVGILVAQALGTGLDVSAGAASASAVSHRSWRFVPAVAGLVGLAQLVLGLLVAVDSPAWVESDPASRDPDAAKRIRQRLWKGVEKRSSTIATPAALEGGEEREGLLSTDEHAAPRHRTQRPAKAELSLSQLLNVTFGPSASPSQSTIRRGTLLILFTQISQQLSGVNAVFYFSSGILKDVLPSDAGAGAVGLGIVVVNALMTFPPIFLIPEHRLGRKKLLLLSSATMCISSTLLGLAILSGAGVLSALCIVVFVAGFSVGLGPIPFLILPELVPREAVSAASSLGLAVNMTMNVLLASTFLPLKSFLASLDGHGGGSVFWVFSVVNAVAFVGVGRAYRYEPAIEDAGAGD